MREAERLRGRMWGKINDPVWIASEYCQPGPAANLFLCCLRGGLRLSFVMTCCAGPYKWQDTLTVNVCFWTTSFLFGYSCTGFDMILLEFHNRVIAELLTSRLEQLASGKVGHLSISTRPPVWPFFYQSAHARFRLPACHFTSDSTMFFSFSLPLPPHGLLPRTSFFLLPLLSCLSLFLLVSLYLPPLSRSRTVIY